MKKRRAYGRKVKRVKSLYGKKKSGFRKAAEIAVMVVILAGLGFVGYAAGGPIIDFIKNGLNNPSQPMGWTPPEPIDGNGEDGTGSEGGASEDGDSSGGDEPAPAALLTGKTVCAPVNVLMSESSLSAYLQAAKADGYEACAVELKDGEGRLLYKSSIEVIKDTEIIAGTLTAEEIAAAFARAGIKPVARINTLMDRLSPGVIKDVTYRFNDDGYAWLDASVENGGKKWANPFLRGTTGYIAELTAELYKAGFKDIVFVNTVFPNFKPYDINVLPSEFTDVRTRYGALADLVNKAAEKTPEAGIIVEMSLADVINPDGLNETAEILRGKIGLAAKSVILVFERDKISALDINPPLPADFKETVKTAFTQAVKQTGDLDVIPCIDKAGLAGADVEKAVAALNELGYDNFIIKN